MKSSRLSVVLFCLTASHRNTEFDVLDAVSRAVDADLARRLHAHDFVRGAVVLATCNRFEVYLELDEPLTSSGALAREAVLEAVAGADADIAGALSETAATLCGDAAVHHLFTVSSGLQSMVVGEEEISGQVQRALTTARSLGTSSTMLERAFQKATHTTRTVRARGDLAAAGRSLARLAVQLIDSRVTDWSTVRLLLVGTGQYAATTIAALRTYGARDIRVYSATGRAAQFATRYGLRAEDDLRAAVADADIVVTCTSQYTVTAADIPDDSARLIVDLGLPRNVDPAVGELAGVELLDLEIIGRHADLPELQPRATELVGSVAASFSASQAAAPAIVALRRYIQDALDAALARAGGADSAAAAALRHFAGVLAHTPSVRARELAVEGRLDEFVRALDVLFGIQVPPAILRAIDREAG